MNMFISNGGAVDAEGRGRFDTGGLELTLQNLSIHLKLSSFSRLGDFV